MLQNAYFVAKIGADTAENEQHFAEILPKTGNYPTGPEDGWRATFSLAMAVQLAPPELTGGGLPRWWRWRVFDKDTNE